AVRRRREHHEMPSLLADKPLQQIVALMAALPRRGAGMCLVDDDQLGAGPQKLGTPPLALDVIEADDGVRVRRKNTLARRKVTFEPRRAGGRDRNGPQVEAPFELGHPLIDEVRGTEHGEPLDVATIEKLACDER